MISHPEVPPEIMDPSWSQGCSELEYMWYEVLKELTDDQFANRTHGNRRTYEAGCTGQLCRKSVREHGRRRNGTKIGSKYEYIDPVLDLFEKRAKEQIEHWKLQMLKSLSIHF